MCVCVCVWVCVLVRDYFLSFYVYVCVCLCACNIVSWGFIALGIRIVFLKIQNKRFSFEVCCSVWNIVSMSQYVKKILDFLLKQFWIIERKEQTDGKLSRLQKKLKFIVYKKENYEHFRIFTWKNENITFPWNLIKYDLCMK